MSDIADQVAAISTKLDTLTTAVQAIAAPATVDLSPVLAAIADVRAQLDVTPDTPPAPPAAG